MYFEIGFARLRYFVQGTGRFVLVFCTIKNGAEMCDVL